MPMRSQLPKQDAIIFKLNEFVEHDMAEILYESMAFEIQGVELYHGLLTLAEQSGSITLEEHARRLIAEEAMHISDIDKILRQPGDVAQVVKNEAP